MNSFIVILNLPGTPDFTILGAFTTVDKANIRKASYMKAEIDAVLEDDADLADSIADELEESIAITSIVIDDDSVEVDPF